MVYLKAVGAERDIGPAEQQPEAALLGRRCRQRGCRQRQGGRLRVRQAASKGRRDVGRRVRCRALWRRRRRVAMAMALTMGNEARELNELFALPAAAHRARRHLHARRATPRNTGRGGHAI